MNLSTSFWDLPFSVEMSPLFHIYHIPMISHLTMIFFLASGDFWTPKTFRTKGEVETAFKDFLASINNVIYACMMKYQRHWCQEIFKCFGIIFWLIKTMFKFINSGLKIYLKIGHYFLINYIYIYIYKVKKIFPDSSVGETSVDWSDS